MMLRLHRFLLIHLPKYIVLHFFIILSIVTAFVITHFIVRKRITKYEEKHKKKFSKVRERIRDVTQKLILKLVEKLKRRGGNPADYEMIFFFRDYEGIKVVKESRGRILKKKYPIYTVIPSIE